MNQVNLVLHLGGLESRKFLELAALVFIRPPRTLGKSH